MRKNLEIPQGLLRNLKVEAVNNGTTLYALAGEIIEHYLETDVPHVARIEGPKKKTQLEVDETVWEQARALAHKNGISLWRAFEESAVHLGYAAGTR